jgi:UDP-N-acetylglucosamine/UDP-N-acetylgalactosamine diphosphorylase
MKTDDTLRLLEKFGQGHILNHLRRLDSPQQQDLIRDIQKIDLDLIFGLYRSHSLEQEPQKRPGKIQSAPIIPVPKTLDEIKKKEEARFLGESLIREQKVAILVVAGGQGSRLGFEGPKGKFPISPLRRKSLFQIFAESIKALSLRHRVEIPLIIMTSRENEKETREFFEQNKFFGLGPKTVHFFSQGMLPTLTPDGKLILSDDTHLLANPDGHGGSLKAFHDSGLLRKLMDDGYSDLFYFQVDNPIVKIADPVFLGFHRMAESEISTKVVRRQNPEEKVGIYGLVDGKPAIIEYSDFSPEEYQSMDGTGNIRHWAGNIAVHVLSLAFIDRLNRHGFALPYHRAVKDVEGIGKEGRAERTKGWKFETFVFDAIPLARRTCCVEVIREEEFSPVKNREGIDSPETARMAMINLHRHWLEGAGVQLASDAKVEISPLYALDEKELMEKVRGKGLKVGGDLYLE